MKLLLLALSAYSLTAFACPAFTGTYSCVYKNNLSKLTVTQTTGADGAVTYNFSDGAFIADAQVKNLPESDELKNATFKAWCEGDVVKQELSGHSWSEAHFFGDLDTVTTISKTDNVLKEIMVGTMKNHGGTFPLGGEEVCTLTPSQPL